MPPKALVRIYSPRLTHGSAYRLAASAMSPAKWQLNAPKYPKTSNADGFIFFPLLFDLKNHHFFAPASPATRIITLGTLQHGHLCCAWCVRGGSCVIRRLAGPNLVENAATSLAAYCPFTHLRSVVIAAHPRSALPDTYWRTSLLCCFARLVVAWFRRGSSHSTSSRRLLEVRTPLYIAVFVAATGPARPTASLLDTY